MSNFVIDWLVACIMVTIGRWWGERRGRKQVVEEYGIKDWDGCIKQHETRRGEAYAKRMAELDHAYQYPPGEVITSEGGNVKGE